MLPSLALRASVPRLDMRQTQPRAVQGWIVRRSFPLTTTLFLSAVGHSTPYLL
jgi:hypothetical protein